MDTNSAETIAIQALGFLASDEYKLRSLCAQTGMAEQDLKSNAADPDFLAGVLDFLLLEEAWLLEFAEFVDLDPQYIARARTKLPGGHYIQST